MTSTVLRHKASTAEARSVALADALSVPDGGFSVEAFRGRDIRSGYAVAVHPDREQQISGPVRAEDVKAYVFANADVLAKAGAVFGGWRNPSDGVAYLDVTRVVATRAQAEALARKHNQLAYYDFAAGVSVPV